MVFVKVRETYDLHTVKNKMTVIGIHTPHPNIIKVNYPGLLMQCRAYRPVSCDVRVACASVLPLDPLGVGTEAGDVAPEDVFNPILYKAMSNKGMSQLEARINKISATGVGADTVGNSAWADVDSLTTKNNFGVYYALLSQTGVWRHASPQNGFAMEGLRPLVYEMNYNYGDMQNYGTVNSANDLGQAPDIDGNKTEIPLHFILGKAKPMPFLNCTSYSVYDDSAKAATDFADSGFPSPTPGNCEIDVPYLKIMCGCIIVPPSRLHELYYRMVVEWTIEFSSLRPIGEITDFSDMNTRIAAQTHYIDYTYAKTKEAVTGSDESIMDSDSCMVSANVDVNKVM